MMASSGGGAHHGVHQGGDHHGQQHAHAHAANTIHHSTLEVVGKGEEEFDDAVSDAAQYGKPHFWDYRYANEHEPFEWYYDYSAFRDIILDNIPLHFKVMMAGCGSSNMIGDMVDDGYEQLVAADLSRVCIAQLKYRYKDIPQISFFQGTLLDTGKHATTSSICHSDL